MSGPLFDLRSLLRNRIREAAAAAGLEQGLPEESGIVLELPRESAHGDVACPLAFSLAKHARRAPREIAKAIRERFQCDSRIERVEEAGGGYLNFFLGDEIWQGMLAAIESAGPEYGNGSALSGQKILVEFVSANPTGPLLVVNARHAALGDALCRCLAAAGAQVHREYYVNDAGSQVRNLALSVEARWRESLGEKAEIPPDGYHGDYVAGIAERAKAEFTDAFLSSSPEDRVAKLAGFSVSDMLAQQKADLRRLRVDFDAWFSEKSLHDQGKVKPVLEALREKGVVFEKEGAQWFEATRFGDDKDRVLVRSDGQPTYVLPDAAYHLDKFARGYTKIINIVGADHQKEMEETIPRVMGILGRDVAKLEVITVQWVNLKRGGQKVAMSKRAGSVVPLKELLDDVGEDAARFFFLLRAPSSHFDFDLDLAKSKSFDNPVYYIQYAHARLCSLIEFARGKGVERPPVAEVSCALLAEDETKFVLRKLARYPLVLEKAALGRTPHILTHELLELAQAVHQFYTRYRVIGSGSAETQLARLALVFSARQTLANGLNMLGVSAPEKM